MYFILLLKLMSSPSISFGEGAGPLSQEQIKFVCAVSFGPLLEKAYQEKDTIITPIFDEKTDEKLLKLHGDIVTQDSKALDVFSSVAIPIYQEKLKDEMSICSTLMKIKSEICGDNFFKNDCDPTYSKRADGKVLFDSYMNRLRERFFRQKSLEANAEPNMAPISSRVGGKIYLFVAVVWVLIIAFFLFQFLQPAKKCTNCGHSLPKFRIPSDIYELLAGGWTCQNCGTKLTRKLKKRF